MPILTIILLVLLIGGFIATFTKAGRILFDVAVFIVLIFLLAGQLKL